MSQASDNVPLRATVVGNGIAGICAARVLSKHYEEVVIVERDALPDHPTHRTGVPQSHHVHALLLRGLDELEALFPGFEAELTARGAARMDIGSELAHYSEWGWAPRETLGITPVAASRLLFEFVARDLLRRSCDNLRFVEQTRALGLVTDKRGRGQRVTGLRIKTKGQEEEVLASDLVVDATGRGSKSLRWLDELGLSRPEEEFVDSHSTYASRFYRLPPTGGRPEDWWWRGMMIDAAPPDHPHFGLLMPIENEGFVVTLCGINRNHPPTDEQGFLRFVKNLRSDALANVLEICEPASDIHGSRSLFNRARRFDQWNERLDGFVVTGDASMALNALHGQGISAHAASSAVLGRCLERVGPNASALPKLFHREQRKFQKMVWDLAVGADCQWPGTEGKRPLAFKLGGWFAREGFRAAHEIPSLKKTFGPLYHLQVSPYSLLKPRVIATILWASVRRRLKGGRVLPAELSSPRLPQG